ncbi:hypothetical protein [Kingella sp. (in: b-proteobacteria)]|uniref:hypothetical protein n=1 Tax=Kingella sp. (in: b-proteobacteria) TaxID=2020713 RepID=UPI0026DD255F|nr:hypothetical protein [Kingella sp. (in: b-proteobacteria)]
MMDVTISCGVLGFAKVSGYAGLVMVDSKQYGLKILQSVPSPAGGGRLGWGW